MKSSATTIAVKKRKIFHFTRTTVIEIISALFILMFFYTALSKSLNIGPTRDVLRLTHTFPKYDFEIAWGVVIIEYLTALSLFFPKTRRIGLYTSFSLMIIFTGYIGYMLAVNPNLPCSCGGVISKMNWTQHLIFNVFFATLAYIAIRLSKTSFEPMRHDTIQAIYT